MILKLLRNEECLIDDEDYELVHKLLWKPHYRWRLEIPYGYAVCDLNFNGKKICGRIHRVIMNVLGTNKIIDHINRNRLDNRKTNLRIATYSENSRNRYEPNDVGVIKRKLLGGLKYDVNISVNNKTKYIGRFNSKEDALNARKQAEQKFWIKTDETNTTLNVVDSKEQTNQSSQPCLTGITV